MKSMGEIEKFSPFYYDNKMDWVTESLDLHPERLSGGARQCYRVAELDSTMCWQHAYREKNENLHRKKDSSA